MISRLVRSHPLASAFLFYLLLAVVLTWPLAAGIGSRVPRGDSDLWQNYWNIWWWERSLSGGTSPFHTDLLFHPTGGSLSWHTHSPANVIPGAAAAWLAERCGLDGPAAALDLATLAGFALAALGAHLLALELVGGGFGPAVLAGIVFGFFPQHVEQSLEHLNLASYWAMGFALLFLLRTVRGGGARAWVPAAIFFAVNALLSWHNAVLILFPALALAAVELRRAERRGRPLAGLGLSALLAALLLLPFLWPMISEAAAGHGGLKQPVQKPIDPLFLVIPQAGHPLWGAAVAPLYGRFRAYPSVGFVSYLGLAALGLWAAAWTRAGARNGGGPLDHQPPRPASGGFALWTALAALHLVLSLGRSPLVAGVDHPSVTLPFALLELLPGFNTVRVANRYLVVAVLAVSILAAMGGRSLGDRFGRPGARSAFLGGLAALLVLDFLWLPYPMREVPRPAWLSAVAKLPEGGLIDIPTGAGPRAAEDMLTQTRHGRPIAGGYVSRTPEEIQATLRAHPVLRQLFEAHPSVPPISGETLSEAIRALGVRIAVVHLDRERERIEEERERARTRDPADLYTIRLFNPEKGTPRADLARIRSELAASFGPPVYADLDSEVYLVR